MRDLAVDRLPAALEVVRLEDAHYGEAGPRGPRAPHRHDYHELLWTREGAGAHLIDGERYAVRPGTVTVIGRGQVHVFERAAGLYGAVVRFGDEMVLEAPAWLVGGRGALTAEVPPSSVASLEALVGTLADELARPADACSVGLLRHFLSALLLWVERWYDGGMVERGEDASLRLYRRFVTVLERDFARHHDAAWFADALAVPAAALSRALAEVTGRTTKQLVIDRVMVEAARLLRYTDLTVGEVAYRTGFEDQLYFSRAFKRRYDRAPMRYRDFYRVPSRVCQA